MFPAGSNENSLKSSVKKSSVFLCTVLIKHWRQHSFPPPPPPFNASIVSTNSLHTFLLLLLNPRRRLFQI